MHPDLHPVFQHRLFQRLRKQPSRHDTGISSAFLVRIPVALFMASLPNTNLTLVGLSTPITTVYGILFFLVCFAWMKKAASR